MMTYCRCRATLSKNCLFQHLRCAQSSSLIFPTWRSYPLVDPIHVIVFSTVITGELWRVYMKYAKIFNILTILIFSIFQIQTSFLHGLKTFHLNPRSFATIQYWHICRPANLHMRRIRFNMPYLLVLKNVKYDLKLKLDYGQIFEEIDTISIFYTNVKMYTKLYFIIIISVFFLSM